jgi:hypothetical protein
LIFICTGRFTNEHQIGVRISDAEYRLCSGAREMRALRANGNAFANRAE